MRAAACLFLPLALCLGMHSAQAQNTIKLQAYIGTTGQRLPNQRLVIFAASMQKRVAFHEASFDLTTNQDGEAYLVLDLAKVRWIQVWADSLTLCQSDPTDRSFNVSEIISSGLSSPNTCSKVSKPNEAGNVIVFARPATIAEKMRR